jgi:hypothetical protein
VGLVTDTTVTIQPEEIKEAVWLPLAEVPARLTYPAAQSVLAQATQLLTREALF